MEAKVKPKRKTARKAKKPLKHAGGRPTIYRDEYADGIVEYFAEQEDFPTMAGYAASLNVGQKTVVNWTEKHPKFLLGYEKAKEIQEDRLVKMTLGGKYNPTFAIFFSKNRLGYVDKQEIKQEVNAKTSVSVENFFEDEKQQA